MVMIMMAMLKMMSQLVLFLFLSDFGMHECDAVEVKMPCKP